MPVTVYITCNLYLWRCHNGMHFIIMITKEYRMQTRKLKKRRMAFPISQTIMKHFTSNKSYFVLYDIMYLLYPCYHVYVITCICWTFRIMWSIYFISHSLKFFSQMFQKSINLSKFCKVRDFINFILSQRSQSDSFHIRYILFPGQ